MARRESEREDLLREATALVERAELSIEGMDEPIVVGFRPDGAASFFFGAEPVYQFNAAGELRRAYVDGLLYKAEGGKLVSLSRQRTDREVALVRAALDTRMTEELLEAMRQRLQGLQASLRDGMYSVVGQIPADAEIPAKISRWLGALPAAVPIAKTPHVR